MLEARNISYRVGRKTLLQETTLSFSPGRFHVIMGPNGAGKSTLLQLLASELKPATGTVCWEGQELRVFSSLDLARRRAVLSQHYALQFPITVSDVVRLGRYPYAGLHAHAEEEVLVRDCLEQMSMYSFAERDYGTLSGGEAQKVQMSRVLAQLGGASARNKLLLLDEPVAHLDIRYQHALLSVAKNLCGGNNTVIAVLHDINLALRYADRLLFMKDGVVSYDLECPDRLTAEMLRDVFAVDACILSTEGGKRFIVFS